MPLDGSGVAAKPDGTTAVSNTTIQSSAFNSVINDIYAIFNSARPVAYGGTGATSALTFTDLSSSTSVITPFLKDQGGTVTTGGSANAQTVTLNQAVTALSTGFFFTVKFGYTNTSTTVTLNVNSIGAKSVKVFRGGALVDPAVGDLQANNYARVLYDGTYMVMLGSLDASAILTTRGDLLVRGASAPQRFAVGAANAILSSDGTDPGYKTQTALLDSLNGSVADGHILKRASGTWTTSADWEPIEIGTALSGASSWSRTNLSAYSALKLSGTVRSSAGATVQFRTSTNNGSSYDAGSGYGFQYLTAVTSTVSGSFNTSAGLLIGAPNSDSSYGNAAFEAVIENFNKSRRCDMRLIRGMQNGAANSEVSIAFGQRNDSTARNAIQLIGDSGSLTGQISLWGMRG